MGIFSVYGFYWFSGGWKKEIGTIQIDESYEMQKPKNSVYGIYDLSHRRVVIHKVDENGNPLVDKDNNDIDSAPIHPKTAKTVTPAPGAGAKSAVAATAKKDQSKKNKDKMARSKLKVDIVNNQGSKPLQLQQNIDNVNKSNQVNHSDHNIPQQASIRQNEPRTEEADKDEQQKLSPGQWFSLLQNQPTKDNATKYLKSKNQIGMANFYDIITKLLKDSQSDRQKAALYILDQDVSLETYVYFLKLPEDFKKQEVIAKSVAASLKKYEDKSRFLILARALELKDSRVVIATQNTILSIVEAQARGGAVSNSPPSNPASASADSAGKISKSDFYVFKLTLSRLSASSEKEIASVATRIYSALWQGTIVADNPAN